MNFHTLPDLLLHFINLDEGFKVVLWRPSAKIINDTEHVTMHDATHDTTHDTIHDQLIFREIDELPYRLVVFLSNEMGRPAIMTAMGLKNRSHFAESYLNPALAKGYIEMTIPQTPTSKTNKH